MIYLIVKYKKTPTSLCNLETSTSLFSHVLPIEVNKYIDTLWIILIFELKHIWLVLIRTTSKRKPNYIFEIMV